MDNLLYISVIVFILDIVTCEHVMQYYGSKEDYELQNHMHTVH